MNQPVIGLLRLYFYINFIMQKYLIMPKKDTFTMIRLIKHT